MRLRSSTWSEPPLVYLVDREVAAWSNSSNHLSQKLRAASIETREWDCRRQDLFEALPSGSSLRELVTRNGYPAPSRHECPLPAKQCHFDFPSLTKAYTSSRYRMGSTLDAAHIFQAFAHAPHLDDLTICCTNFNTRAQPVAFPTAALKRYAFHHWGPGDSMDESTSSGWSRPLNTSIESLQSFELTIRDPNDLHECRFPTLLKSGASFSRLEALKVSMAWDLRFEAFLPLLVLCPRVQDLTISVDAYKQTHLPPFGYLINALPHSTALKRLAIGLRMWNSYYHVIAPEPHENEFLDKCMAIVVRHINAQRLRSFAIIVDDEIIGVFAFTRVAKACRSRRIAFRVEGDPSPGMRA